jgi:hypothetical protein
LSQACLGKSNDRFQGERDSKRIVIYSFIHLFIHLFMRMQVSGGWRQRGDWQIVACLRARRKFKLIILKEWTEIKQFVDD